MISWLILSYLSYFVFGASNSTITPIWPSIASTLHVDIIMIGIVMGIYLALYVVFLPLTSILISKMGVKNNLIIGLFFLGISMILYSKVFNIYICIIAISILGIGAAIIDTTLNYYIALKYKPKNLSWLHCMWALGSSVGTYFMATLINNKFNYGLGYMIIGISCIILGAVTFIYKNVEKYYKVVSHNSDKEKNKKPKVNFVEILNKKYVLLFLFCMLLLDFLPGVFSVWYSSYATTIQNKTVAYSSYVISIYFAGQVTSRVLSGFIVEKVGTWRVTLTAIIFVLISSISLLFYINDFIVVITAFIFGVGIAPLYPMCMDIAKNIFGEDQLRGVVGLSGSFAKIGGFLSSAFIGFIIGIFSLNCIFYVLVFASIVAVISFYLLYNFTKNIKTNIN